MDPIRNLLFTKPLNVDPETVEVLNGTAVAPGGEWISLAVQNAKISYNDERLEREQVRPFAGALKTIKSRENVTLEADVLMTVDTAKVLTYWFTEQEIQSGTTPAASNHAFSGVGGDVKLLTGFVVRDLYNEAVTGCAINTFNITGSDGEFVTASITVNCLFIEKTTETIPDDVIDLTKIYQLRDAIVEIDDVEIDGVNSVSLNLNKALKTPRYKTGKNIITESSGERTQYPSGHRKSKGLEVTGSIEVLDTNVSLIDKIRAGKTCKLEVAFTGDDLGTTPEAAQMLKFTFETVTFKGDALGDLTNDEDINTTLEFTAFVNPANSYKVFGIEIVDEDYNEYEFPALGT